MPFLNSLVDPYGVLARGTYPEDNDEEERRKKEQERQRMTVAAPEPSVQRQTGTDRPGPGFLVSLLQSGPAIARIMSAKSTDDIQRALSDHAAVMERYTESRQLQQERQRERTFAAEQAEQRRAAEIADREDTQQAQVELEGLRDQNANARLNRQLGAAEAARTAEATTKADEKFNEAMATARAQVGSASAFDPQTKARAEEFIQFAEQHNGQLPPDAYEGIARAKFIQEKQLIKERQAKEQGRVLTPQEQILAGVEARLDYAAEMYKDRDPTLDRRSEQEHYESLFGPGSFQRDWNIKTQGATFPPPADPIGLEVERTLSNPNSPDFPEMKARVERMKVDEFRAQLPALLEGVAPERQRKVLERIAAYASPEVQREITRMVSGSDGTTTRAGKLVQEALGGVRDTASNSLPAKALKPVGHVFRSGLDFLTARVPE